VRGEACVTLGLGLSERTPASSDVRRRPSVCLAGSAINQDGRSSSLTAPHGPSQQQVCLSLTSTGPESALKWRADNARHSHNNDLSL
jgi:hypothetical protein